MKRLISVSIVLCALLTLAACRSSASGAAGVRERLDGYPDFGWTDTKMDRFGARVCVQFPDGPFADPRVSGSAASPGYAACVGHPKPQWITWMAPWIWQDFYDSYCSHT